MLQDQDSLVVQLSKSSLGINPFAEPFNPKNEQKEKLDDTSRIRGMPCFLLEKPSDDVKLEKIGAFELSHRHIGQAVANKLIGYLAGIIGSAEKNIISSGLSKYIEFVEEKQSHIKFPVDLPEILKILIGVEKNPEHEGPASYEKMADMSTFFNFIIEASGGNILHFGLSGSGAKNIMENGKIFNFSSDLDNKVCIKGFEESAKETIQDILKKLRPFIYGEIKYLREGESTPKVRMYHSGHEGLYVDLVFLTEKENKDFSYHSASSTVRVIINNDLSSAQGFTPLAPETHDWLKENRIEIIGDEIGDVISNLPRLLKKFRNKILFEKSKGMGFLDKNLLARLYHAGKGTDQKTPVNEYYKKILEDPFFCMRFLMLLYLEEIKFNKNDKSVSHKYIINLKLEIENIFELTRTECLSIYREELLSNKKQLKKLNSLIKQKSDDNFESGKSELASLKEQLALTEMRVARDNDIVQKLEKSSVTHEIRNMVYSYNKFERSNSEKAFANFYGKRVQASLSNFIKKNPIIHLFPGKKLEEVTEIFCDNINFLTLNKRDFDNLIPKKIMYHESTLIDRVAFEIAMLLFETAATYHSGCYLEYLNNIGIDQEHLALIAINWIHNAKDPSDLFVILDNFLLKENNSDRVVQFFSNSDHFAALKKALNRASNQVKESFSTRLFNLAKTYQCSHIQLTVDLLEESIKLQLMKCDGSNVDASMSIKSEAREQLEYIIHVLRTEKFQSSNIQTYVDFCLIAIKYGLITLNCLCEQLSGQVEFLELIEALKKKRTEQLFGFDNSIEKNNFTKKFDDDICNHFIKNNDFVGLVKYAVREKITQEKISNFMNKLLLQLTIEAATVLVFDLGDKKITDYFAKLDIFPKSFLLKFSAIMAFSKKIPDSIRPILNEIFNRSEFDAPAVLDSNKILKKLTRFMSIHIPVNDRLCIIAAILKNYSSSVYAEKQISIIVSNVCKKMQDVIDGNEIGPTLDDLRALDSFFQQEMVLQSEAICENYSKYKSLKFVYLVSIHEYGQDFEKSFNENLGDISNIEDYSKKLENLIKCVAITEKPEKPLKVLYKFMEADDYVVLKGISRDFENKFSSLRKVLRFCNDDSLRFKFSLRFIELIKNTLKDEDDELIFKLLLLSIDLWLDLTKSKRDDNERHFFLFSSVLKKLVVRPKMTFFICNSHKKLITYINSNSKPSNKKSPYFYLIKLVQHFYSYKNPEDRANNPKLYEDDFYFLLKKIRTQMELSDISSEEIKELQCLMKNLSIECFICLINFYLECQNLDDARKVFEKGLSKISDSDCSEKQKNAIKEIKISFYECAANRLITSKEQADLDFKLVATSVEKGIIDVAIFFKTIKNLAYGENIKLLERLKSCITKNDQLKQINNYLYHNACNRGNIFDAFKYALSSDQASENIDDLLYQFLFDFDLSKINKVLHDSDLKSYFETFESSEKNKSLAAKLFIILICSDLALKEKENFITALFKNSDDFFIKSLTSVDEILKWTLKLSSSFCYKNKLWVLGVLLMAHKSDKVPLGKFKECVDDMVSQTQRMLLSNKKSYVESQNDIYTLIQVLKIDFFQKNDFLAVSRTKFFMMTALYMQSAPTVPSERKEILGMAVRQMNFFDSKKYQLFLEEVDKSLLLEWLYFLKKNELDNFYFLKNIISYRNLFISKQGAVEQGLIDTVRQYFCESLEKKCKKNNISSDIDFVLNQALSGHPVIAHINFVFKCILMHLHSSSIKTLENWKAINFKLYEYINSYEFSEQSSFYFKLIHELKNIKNLSHLKCQIVGDLSLKYTEVSGLEGRNNLQYVFIWIYETLDSDSFGSKHKRHEVIKYLTQVRISAKENNENCAKSLAEPLKMWLTKIIHCFESMKNFDNTECFNQMDIYIIDILAQMLPALIYEEIRKNKANGYKNPLYQEAQELLKYCSSKKLSFYKRHPDAYELIKICSNGKLHDMLQSISIYSLKKIKNLNKSGGNINLHEANQQSYMMLISALTVQKDKDDIIFLILYFQYLFAIYDHIKILSSESFMLDDNEKLKYKKKLLHILYHWKCARLVVHSKIKNIAESYYDIYEKLFLNLCNIDVKKDAEILEDKSFLLKLMGAFFISIDENCLKHPIKGEFEFFLGMSKSIIIFYNETKRNDDFEAKLLCLMSSVMVFYNTKGRMDFCSEEERKELLYRIDQYRDTTLSQKAFDGLVKSFEASFESILKDQKYLQHLIQSFTAVKKIVSLRVSKSENPLDKSEIVYNQLFCYLEKVCGFLSEKLTSSSSI